MRHFVKSVVLGPAFLPGILFWLGVVILLLAVIFTWRARVVPWQSGLFVLAMGLCLTGGFFYWGLKTGALTAPLLNWLQTRHAFLNEKDFTRFEKMSPKPLLVVLGGERSEFRAREACRVLSSVNHLRVVTTGGVAGEMYNATVLEHLIQQHGFPDLICDKLPAANTQDEARQVKRYQETHGRTPVILVTCPSHMPRAVRWFRSQGLKVIPSPCEPVSSFTRPFRWSNCLWSAKSERNSRWALVDFCGLVAAELAGLLEPAEKETPDR